MPSSDSKGDLCKEIFSFGNMRSHMRPNQACTMDVVKDSFTESGVGWQIIMIENYTHTTKLWTF
jgi:hypothetical protein